MINQKMKAMGAQGSAIRELFEYGKIRKQDYSKKEEPKKVITKLPNIKPANPVKDLAEEVEDEQ